MQHLIQNSPFILFLRLCILFFFLSFFPTDCRIQIKQHTDRRARLIAHTNILWQKTATKGRRDHPYVKPAGRVIQSQTIRKAEKYMVIKSKPPRILTFYLTTHVIRSKCIYTQICLSSIAIFLHQPLHIASLTLLPSQGNTETGRYVPLGPQPGLLRHPTLLENIPE